MDPSPPPSGPPPVTPEGRGTAPPARKRQAGIGGRNLPVAIASGVALAVLFLASLYVGPYVFLGFVAVLVLIALYELDVAFRSRGLRPATPIAAGAGIVAFFGSYATGASAQSLSLVLLIVGTLAWALLDPGLHRPGDAPAPPLDPLSGMPPGGATAAGTAAPVRGSTAANIGATCLMMLWVPFLASFIGLLLARPDGVWYLVAVVALSVSNDIGAYAFGSAVGRTKLAPSVSPAKSWEGFAGGIGTALAVAALIVARFPGLDLRTALGLGLAVAVASTVGDLAESLVKRDLGVKDLGRIIPGHGGIMDRADAIIFALPAGHLVLLAFGL
jgi:phosphatidate cytidylyltransferase